MDARAKHCRDLFEQAERLVLERGKLVRRSRGYELFSAYVAGLVIHYSSDDDLTMCVVLKRDDRTVEGRRAVLSCNLYEEGEFDLVKYRPGA